MYHKAKLFKDEENATLILKSKFPSEHKSLGRMVKNFDETIQNNFKFKIVCSGNYLKYIQNEELKEILKNTGNKILVEANKKDNIWGIGMYFDDVNLFNTNMCGKNLLGKALMKVRKDIV